MSGPATEGKISCSVNFPPLLLLPSVQSTLLGLPLFGGQKKPVNFRQEDIFHRQGGERLGSIPPSGGGKASLWVEIPKSRASSENADSCYEGRAVVVLSEVGGMLFSHTLTLTHVLGVGEHAEESDNTKQRMRCDILDTGVIVISPKKLLYEFLNGMNEMIYTWLISKKY